MDELVKATNLGMPGESGLPPTGLGGGKTMFGFQTLSNSSLERNTHTRARRAADGSAMVHDGDDLLVPQATNEHNHIYTAK